MQRTKGFIAGLLLGAMFIAGFNAQAFDTRTTPTQPQLNALIRCHGDHAKATVVMWRGFRETGGSLAEFTLTGSQTRKACS